MKRLIILALSLLFTMSLAAFSAVYNVRSLGMRVATISMDVNGSRIRVHAVTDASNPLAPAMDNHYLAEYNSTFLPNSYERTVAQVSDNHRVTTSYNHRTSRATQTWQESGRDESFALEPNTRDLFSFLALLSHRRPSTSGSYVIDANSQLWDLSLGYAGRENLRTKQGQISCSKYTIRLSGRGSRKAPYVDMVTNNILNPSTRLTLWIADSGLIAAASVKRGLSSMTWELERYSL